VDAGWTDFFGTCAQVAVTLFALLFAAMQLRYQEWRGSRLKTVAALSALAELFVPTLASMIILMPAHPVHAAGIVAGLFGLVVIGWHWRVFAGELDKERDDPFNVQQKRLSWISIGVYSLITISGIIGGSWGPYLLAGACVWLLFSGSFEAWYVLDPPSFERTSAGRPAGQSGAPQDESSPAST
jgi:hypothetical protein